MYKLSKKDEKIYQHFIKMARQNPDSVNHISTSLQSLIGDIKRMGEVNFLYRILGDPFFDFEVIGDILRTQSVPVIEIDIDTNLLNLVCKNGNQEYFNILTKKINENNLKMDKLPSQSGYQGSPFFVINRYIPQISTSRLQSKNSDIKQLADLFDEIARLISSPQFRNFGIVLLLPEKLEEQGYKTFREWDRFIEIKIRVPESNYRTEVCKKLIEEFSEMEHVTFLKRLEIAELTSIIDQAFDSIGFNPQKFLNKLKEKVKTALPKPVTKMDVQFFKDVVSVLSSTDKTRHAKLRALLQEMRETNFDARNILIELITIHIQEIEKAFDSELREKCKTESLRLMGEYPNYFIDIDEFGTQIRIEVRSPYGNVYVDGEPLENKFPIGVVERIKEKIDKMKKLRPTSITEDESINLFVGCLMMYKGANKEIIDINEFLDSVLGFLNSNGIYPVSVDKQRRGREYLKEEFAKASVIETMKKYVTFETGKITEYRGIRLSGLGDKLYTIMKIQRSDN